MLTPADFRKQLELLSKMVQMAGRLSEFRTSDKTTIHEIIDAKQAERVTASFGSRNWIVIATANGGVIAVNPE